MGLAGLFILGFFVAVATFAIFANDSGTRITEATGPRLASPSADYPLGTDDQGRSVLTLTIHGAQVSLLVGLTATAITMVIGSAIGLVAGFRGGWVDQLLMRITDFFVVLPAIAVLAIAIRRFGNSTLGRQ
jgi:peptide/nickel transport system permease protein